MRAGQIGRQFNFSQERRRGISAAGALDPTLRRGGYRDGVR